MKKNTKKSVFKAAYVASAIILAVVLALNIVAICFADFLTLWLCSTSSLSAADREKGEALATQIEEEGIVMVKNENQSLPLSELADTQVNVFGWAASEWVAGGSGSGRVVNNTANNAMTPATGLLDALKSADISYNTAITDMYQNFKNSRDSFHTLDDNAQKFYRLFEPAINDTTYYTSEMLENAKTYSSTALVVLGRVAGESNDAPTVQYKMNKKNGSILTDNTRTYLDISTEEEGLLKYVGENYENVIVIVNSTNTMNLSFMDSIPGLDSCLIVGGTGNNAAKGVVNVLYGVSPSGRTSDTYAYDFKTSPAFANSGDVGTGRYPGTTGLYPATKGTVNGDDHYRAGVSYLDYLEGIYVGYKWYETADVEGYWSDVKNDFGEGYEGVVQYPFGYGLSYTSFKWDVIETSPAGGALDVDGTIKMTVRVTNTGTVPGKETVQLYYTAPYNKEGIEKSALNLAAFAKTPVDVAPGEAQDLTLEFDVRDMSSYDSQEIKVAGGGYILEAGEYTLTLMNNSHQVAEVDMGSAVHHYNLSKDHVYTTDKTSGNTIGNLFTGADITDGIAIDGSDTQANIKWLSRADFKNTFPETKNENREMHADLKASNLYSREDANAWATKYGAGVEMPTQGATGNIRLYEDDVEVDIFDEDGNVIGTEVRDDVISEDGLLLGDPSNFDSDLWNDVLNQVTISEMTDLTLHGYVQERRVNSVGKDFVTNSVDGPAQAGSFNQTNAGTGYPNATVLAQSWNTQLAKSFGASLAADATAIGYEGLYAPGVNMHRTPFGGRNYEYLSEDPVLTGNMAAGVINGCLEGGVYVYVKHFVLYEQETTRDGLYTWLTEQTLREVYAAPFKILIEDAQVSGLMSAYGRVGSVWAGGSRALLTDLLRTEWGFKGAVITDYADHHEYMNGDQMMRAGGDLWMDGFSNNGKYDFDTTSAAMVTQLRNATKNILYMQLNARWRAENSTDQGISISTGSQAFVWWPYVLIAVDVVAVAACGVWVFLTFKKSKQEA